MIDIPKMDAHSTQNPAKWDGDASEGDQKSTSAITTCRKNNKSVSRSYIPGTQMTLVLLEKGLVLEGSTPKIEDKEVPGIYIYIQDSMIPSSNNLQPPYRCPFL